MDGRERKIERRKRFDGGSGGRGDGDGDGSGQEEDVLPPLRSSQNLWASAVVGKDTSLAASEKDKKFAEGERERESEREILLIDIVQILHIQRINHKYCY